MNVTECPREQDVLDAIDARRWPDRCDEDLRTHVAGCPVCAELGLVGHLLRADHEQWWDAARVPPASLVWWRAQMRARAEAAEAVSRPMLVAQVVFAAVLMGVAGWWLVDGLGRTAGSWQATVTSGWRAMADTLASAPAVFGGVSAAPAVWLAAVAWLLVVPAAVYVALRR
jgi:hypothetical protein